MIHYRDSRLGLLPHLVICGQLRVPAMGVGGEVCLAVFVQAGRCADDQRIGVCDGLVVLAGVVKPGQQAAHELQPGPFLSLLRTTVHGA